MEIITADTQIFNEQASEIKNINRLLRVALINSYPEGKIHLLDVDNNTIITGRNASGKTTLMGVIAPFFGVPLSSIARQSEVKQSFIDFYLPFENSYIVYEYQRDGQQFCVLLRRRGDTPIFHFINSSYDENWFIHIEQNQRYFNNYAQVKESIENQQCIISINLLHSEYEAIISNSPSAMVRAYSKDSQKNITNFKSSFSLPSSSHGSFFGFAPIAYNILQSKLEFDEICKFLVDAMQKQGLLQGGSLSLSTEGINTQLWIRQRKALDDIEALKPKFEQLTVLLADNEAYQSELNTIYHQAILVGNALEEQQAILRDQLTHDARELTTYQDDIDTQQRQHLHQMSILEDEISRTSHSLTQLEQQKTDFELGNQEFKPIAQLQQYAQKLPILENERIQQNSLYQMLKMRFNALDLVIQDIENDYKDRKHKIEADFADNQRYIQEQKSFLNNTLNQKKLELQSQYHADKEANAKHFNQQIEQIYELQNSDKVEQQRLKTLQTNTGFSEHFQQLLNQNLEQQQAIKVKLNQHKKSVQNQSKKVTDFKSQIDTILEEQLGLTREQESLQQKISELKALSHGDNLYSFLLNSEKEQPKLAPIIENIHKTICHDLLKRTDLNPQWQEAEILENSELNNGLFGLNLDTHRIVLTSGQQSLAEIYAEIDQKSKQTLAIQEQLDSFEKQLKALHQQHDNAKIERQQFDSTTQRYEQQQETLSENYQQLKNEAEKVKRAEIAKLTEQLEIINQQLNHHQQKIAEIKQRQAIQQNQLEQAWQQKIAQAEQEFKQNDESLKTELERLKQQAFDDIKQAEIRRDKAIADKGYDRSELTKLEQQIHALDTQIQLAKTAQQRVARYEQFLQSDYQQYQPLTEKKHQLKRDQQNNQLAFEQAQQKILEMVRDLQRRLDESNKTLEQYDKDQKHLQQTMQFANNRLNPALLAELEHINVDTALINNQDANPDIHIWVMQIITQLDKTAQQAKKTTEQGKFVVSDIKNPFIRNPEMFASLLADEQNRAMTVDDNWYIQGKSFKNYLENEHESRKKIIIAHYQIEAEKINNFKSQLDEINSNLIRFTQRINRSCDMICQNLTQLAIESFSMKIHSSITDNQWYPVLNNFSEHFQQWKSRQISQETLPDDTLLASLENVQTYIGQSQLNVEFAKQFKMDLTLKQHGQAEQTATRTQSFKELSSNGTMRIAQLIIYLSLIGMMDVRDVQLKLFIDEIGVLDEANTQELLQLLQQQQISAMCAAPEVVNDAVIPLFTNNIACHRDKKNVYHLSQVEDLASLTLESQLEQYGCFE